MAKASAMWVKEHLPVSTVSQPPFQAPHVWRQFASAADRAALKRMFDMHTGFNQVISSILILIAYDTLI